MYEKAELEAAKSPLVQAHKSLLGPSGLPQRTSEPKHGVPETEFGPKKWER